MEKERLRNMYKEVKITEKKVQERTRRAQLANQPWKGTDKQQTDTSEERKHRVPSSRFSGKELVSPLPEHQGGRHVVEVHR